MVERDIAVNSNQMQDIRFLNQETAGLLKSIRCSNVAFTRRCLYFSLNDTRNLERVRKQYELLGCSRGDNVEFLCMYGFNTTLAGQDTET